LTQWDNLTLNRINDKIYTYRQRITCGGITRKDGSGGGIIDNGVSNLNNNKDDQTNTSASEAKETSSEGIRLNRRGVSDHRRRKQNQSCLVFMGQSAHGVRRALGVDFVHEERRAILTAFIAGS